MKKALLGFAIVLMSGQMPGTTAAAQTQLENPQIEDCQVKPDASATPNQTGEQPKAQAPKAQANDQSNKLTASLAPCDGVLKPPPTGDKNATAPPADTSQMPVIKPGEVPPQPSK
ncbi:hypothetical protein [Mesorhizobium sp.]|uniref:hypothetical protein n=1 Tax=Mesorhizobium sp. TaxID=1871066 RepID=UPI000FEA308E|nr:hypothetical protein [Mesorhizobium sp.]RWN06362.1 MAG: hypothetical protein EOR87_28125 [Mesorhizobium sp.]RWN08578.1 MAG: hypothetical protein EOR88_28210 [Mesorhizobium sp.]